MNLTSVCDPIDAKRISRAADLPTVPLSKRCFDITLIVLAAPAIAPVMAAVALLVKLVSDGPVLFRQKRVGLGGQTFECLKFRTMHVHAPTAVHEQHFAELMKSGRPMVKLDGHDPRLIPFAHLIRAAGLDELPQLFNVLRGEMSLVGPRPSTMNEFAAFSPDQQGRTHGLPGLTGLWQVNGKNRTTFSQMIELDLHYLRTQCLWLDLAILLRTPVAVLNQLFEIVRRRKAVPASPRARARYICPTRRAKKSSKSRAIHHEAQYDSVCQ